MTKVEHPSCYHVGYSLTCAEYDDLRSIADGYCMLCASPCEAPQIDHDHAIGGWAVRGLICHRCNHHLKAVEAGRRAARPEDFAYFANAWHLRQPSSATKAARVRPKVPCPACGHPTVVHGNGRLHRHWSRLKGCNEICTAGA